MNTHRKLKALILTLNCLFFNFITHAQEHNIRVEQDPKFEKLLIEKRKSNTSSTINERFRIQIFNGDIEGSRKILQEFKREFKKTNGSIEFFTPSYKVWVGNFKTRMEAEKMLIDIKNKYPNAFLIKPNR